jgi:hypothetical protein
MNSSAEEVLGSIINAQHIKGDDLFYIGSGIGLSGGLLCVCIIAHYKYIKFKASLVSSDMHNCVANDKDDDATIAVIIDYFDTKQYL